MLLLLGQHELVKGNLLLRVVYYPEIRPLDMTLTGFASKRGVALLLNNSIRKIFEVRFGLSVKHIYSQFAEIY
jgi:hypothetical protein